MNLLNDNTHSFILGTNICHLEWLVLITTDSKLLSGSKSHYVSHWYHLQMYLITRHTGHIVHVPCLCKDESHSCCWLPKAFQRRQKMRRYRNAADREKSLGRTGGTRQDAQLNEYQLARTKTGKNEKWWYSRRVPKNYDIVLPPAFLFSSY